MGVEGVGREVDSQVDFHLVPFFSVVLCSPSVKQGGSGDLVSHCCSNTAKMQLLFSAPCPHPHPHLEQIFQLESPE